MPRVKAAAKKPKKIKKLKKFKSFKKPAKAVAIRKHNAKRPASSLEKQLYAWLEELGIPFKKEYPVGRCHADIFIEPNILVEGSGCFWHACHMCYPEPDKKQIAKNLKDIKRYSFFFRRGFQVVEVWEHEVKNQPEKVKARLKALAPPKE